MDIEERWRRKSLEHGFDKKPKSTGPNQFYKRYDDDFKREVVDKVRAHMQKHNSTITEAIEALNINVKRYNVRDWLKIF